MITVIKKLMDGDTTRLLPQFVRAKAFWEEFLPTHRDDDIATLAKALGDAQGTFEIKCFDNDRGTAKSVMALTCLAALYDEQAGFSNRRYAQRLVKAFEQSYVSLEVKGHVLKVAADMFWLNEE
jgi:hypothetical protein